MNTDITTGFSKLFHLELQMDSFVNGVIMMVLGVIGLLPLLFVVLRLLLIRHRLHPFHYLILSKLAADGIEMLVPLMALSASQLLLGHWLHKQNAPIAGYLALSLQYSSIYSSVAMTVNRLVAVTYPRQYNKWFNRKRTVIYIVACWVLAWTHNAIHLEGMVHNDICVLVEREEQEILDQPKRGETYEEEAPQIFKTAVGGSDCKWLFKYINMFQKLMKIRTLTTGSVVLQDIQLSPFSNNRRKKLFLGNTTNVPGCAIYRRYGCTFTFSPEACQFKFSDKHCGHTLSLFQDLIYNITIAVVTTLVDIYCLLKLNYTKEVVAYSLDRKKKEKPWFFQTTSNSLIYVLMLASFHAADFFEGTTIRFFLTAVPWQIWLASAPIIIICADREYRTSPRSLWKARTKSEVTAAF